MLQGLHLRSSNAPRSPTVADTRSRRADSRSSRVQRCCVAGTTTNPHHRPTPSPVSRDWMPVSSKTKMQPCSATSTTANQEVVTTSPSTPHQKLQQRVEQPSNKRQKRGAAVLTYAAMGSHAAPASDLEALAGFICEGPILSRCGITPESVKTRIFDWVELGKQLARQLGFEHDSMGHVQKMRIYQYYLPVYFWCLQQLVKHRETGAKTALVVGISAPQGCGKSTLVEQLQTLLIRNKINTANVSIDDFYLRFQDQVKLASEHPNNPLLQYRGNAGTHDLQLGAETLKQLRGLRSAQDTASVPRYDKSANQARGDRADPSTWPKVSGPVDILLFEGWMSGFSPLPEEEVKKVDPSLVEVNSFLKSYQAVWDEMVDSWLVIQIGDPQWVFKWRQQAEEGMRASGKPGMSDEQIVDFVNRYMPAYKAYLPTLYSKGPTTARPGRTLIIEVDQQRSPVPQQPQPLM